uniref:Uncharacterized protein n=1 Tax=Eptatretus burgeri TaxID=7764 RepID=A0A8C4N3N2_EPTBU
MASAEPVYCLCRLPYDVTRFMIECDICKDWFHGSCVGVEEHASIDIDLYHCPNCAKLYGPSVLMDVGSCSIGGGMTGDGQPVHTGSPVFIKELKSRMFPSADEILLKPHGSQLSMQFLEQSGFDLPILVAKRDGLGLAVPSTSFSVCDVEQHIGGDRIIDVIDVARQAGIKMSLHEFVQFYTNSNRSNILNVISLEFSNTRLSPLVEPPDVVRQLSWVENHWPQDAPYPTPRVDKYCLMGVKDSYTDFHIDFGGTSVWYHVLKGEKVFYLIKPTNANLALYERWSISSNQNEMFFGDQVDKCYRCVVKQGQTLFIPTGWIHAVLTPVDSCMLIAFWPLHHVDRVNEMEKRLKTADVFAFPNFETLCWYTAQSFLDTFRELRSKGTQPPAYLIQGTKSLNSTLRSWTRKEVLAEHEVDIPDDLIYSQLTKDLAKEVRLAEVFYPSLESEDEEPVFKSRAKKRRSVGDAPWNPAAKVVPSVPRPERPVREGTRVPSIETGLAAAAAKLSQQVCCSHYHIMAFGHLFSISLYPTIHQIYLFLADHEYTSPGGALGAVRGATPMAPGVFLSSRKSTSGTPSGISPSIKSIVLLQSCGKRPRKGLATAKQRLGKILKIQKNGRLLL